MKDRHRIASWVVSVLAFATCPTNQTSAETLQVGELAPLLNLEGLLQAPAGSSADWGSLRGKVVILEFWATWCGPCLLDIPFLNDFEDSFVGKPVQFISITDESEGVIKRFLGNTQMKGWVGIDTDRSAFKAFRVKGRPTTVVIDTNGRIVGWTDLRSLIEDPGIIDDLIDGKERRLSSGTGMPTPLDRYMANLFGDSRNQPLCLISIGRTKNKARSPFGATSRRYVSNGITLLSAIENAFSIPRSQIIIETPLPEGQKFDIIFSWPTGDLRRGELLLQSAIESTFGLTIQRKERLMDVYVLTIPAGTVPSLKPAMSGANYDKETGLVATSKEVLARMKKGEQFFDAIGHMNVLADGLSHYLEIPVIDETVDDGYYAYSFPFNVNKPDKELLIKTVKEKLGLELTRAKRNVEALIVKTALKESADVGEPKASN